MVFFNNATNDVKMPFYYLSFKVNNLCHEVSFLVFIILRLGKLLHTNQKRTKNTQTVSITYVLPFEIVCSTHMHKVSLNIF